MMSTCVDIQVGPSTPCRDRVATRSRSRFGWILKGLVVALDPTTLAPILRSAGIERAWRQRAANAPHPANGPHPANAAALDATTGDLRRSRIPRSWRRRSTCS